MAILLTPQISFTLDEAADFANSCAKKLGIHRNAIADWSFHKKSLDVRHKNPKFMATLLIDIRDDSALRHLEKAGCKPPLPRIQMPDFTRRQVAPRVAVIGAGPSGLFASWTLARAGVKVDLFERGKDAKSRSNDVAQLMHRGILSTESNICFGEGGAGTYSDGKLMTRTKSKYIPIVLELFSKCCNNDRILYESHPHIGTDKLTPMLLNARAHLESLGVAYHFETRIDDIWIDANRCRGIVVNGEKLGYDAVFLCIGHSADEMFETLHHRGVAMAQKPLAIGVRVEHPQELINRIQYGRYADHPLLPAAEYAVRFNDEKLPSAFSFCMCPGGRVVPSHTHPDCCVVNGMSGSFRNGRFANSALVVQVGEESFDDGPLGGLHWIRRIEKKAAENLPPRYAPAQSMTDFIANKTPSNSPRTTYTPGTAPANLRNILPARVANSLLAALPTFDRQMHGFITDSANFIGVETRTSSPVRILRGDDYASISFPGLYPLGEGAGYAGGITSCALDGIHAAISWLNAI